MCRKLALNLQMSIFNGESLIWADNNGFASSIPKKTYQHVVATRSNMISSNSILKWACLKHCMTLDIFRILQNNILIFNICFPTYCCWSFLSSSHSIAVKQRSATPMASRMLNPSAPTVPKNKTISPIASPLLFCMIFISYTLFCSLTYSNNP